MNALAPIRPEALPNERDTAPTLTSRELGSRLCGAMPGPMVRAGLITKADLPALHDFLREAKRLLRGSTPEEVTLHVGKLSLHYPQPSMDENANATRWEDWFDDFADIPPDILAAACRDWRRSSAKWAPSPGQLLEKCVNASLRKSLAARAETVIELLEAQ